MSFIATGHVTDVAFMTSLKTSHKATQEVMGRYAALQAGTEVSIGAGLHALHFPFAGHFLSFNQAVLHHFAAGELFSRREKVQVIVGSGMICAVLKGLSPIGKRLTPMLAILVQSLLFALGVGIFGHNLLGLIIGFLLLSVWGFVQPILLAYLLFGKEFFLAILDLANDLNEKMGLPPRYALAILFSGVVLKFLLATGFAIFLWRRNVRSEKYLAKITNFEARFQSKWPNNNQGEIILASQTRTNAIQRMQMIAKDFIQPIYLLGFSMSVAFVYLSTNADWVFVSYYVLRVLAVSFFVFYFIRYFQIEKFSKTLNRFPAFQIALKQLLNFRERVRPVSK